MFDLTSDLLKQINLGEDFVDEQSVPQAVVGDLNPMFWNRFKTVLSPKEELEFLEKIKLIVKDETGILRPPSVVF